LHPPQQQIKFSMLPRFDRDCGERWFAAGAGDMVSRTEKVEFKHPEAHCIFCTTRTPHQHERRAVAGRIVVRSICLACNSERPKDSSVACD
jgi:hypothetical protein